MSKQVSVCLVSSGSKIAVVHNRLKDRWELPGGKIEEHESPEPGLMRELREELGLRLCESLSPLREVATSEVPSKQRTMHYFAAEASQCVPLFAHDPGEIDKTKWIEARDAGKYLRVEIPPAIGAMIEEITGRKGRVKVDPAGTHAVRR